jgi:hypothetical protein
MWNQLPVAHGDFGNSAADALAWALIAFGITAAHLMSLVHVSAGDLQERLLDSQTSDTSRAKILRRILPMLDREPFWLPKNSRAPRWYWVTLNVVTALLMVSFVALTWRQDIPWVRSPAVEQCFDQMCVISVFLFAVLLPIKRFREWPGELTSEFVERAYRPQIDRLREIATQVGHFVNECEQRGSHVDAEVAWTPADSDIPLFSTPLDIFGCCLHRSAE